MNTQACNREADVNVTAGCMHEHVYTNPYCREHAALFDGEVVCVPCRDFDGHACQVTAGAIAELTHSA